MRPPSRQGCLRLARRGHGLRARRVVSIGAARPAFSQARPSLAGPRWSTGSGMRAPRRKADSISPLSRSQASAARMLSRSASRRSRRRRTSPLGRSDVATLGQRKAPHARAAAEFRPLRRSATNCSQANSRIVSSIRKRGSPVPSSMRQRRLRSTSDATSGRGLQTSSNTASAASSVKPPANTARRRSSTRSSGGSSSWLQAIVSRIVCCRAGASRLPPMSNGKRRSSLARSAAGGKTLACAAASSMASGSPSRRRQISATTATFSGVTENVGSLARVRVRKETDGQRSRSVRRRRQGVARSGNARGRTGISCSPLMRSRSRLVMSTFS